jgi:hypothetical protein
VSPTGSSLSGRNPGYVQQTLTQARPLSTEFGKPHTPTMMRAGSLKRTGSRHCLPFACPRPSSKYSTSATDRSRRCDCPRQTVLSTFSQAKTNHRIVFGKLQGREGCPAFLIAVCPRPDTRVPCSRPDLHGMLEAQEVSPHCRAVRFEPFENPRIIEREHPAPDPKPDSTALSIPENMC